MHLFIVLADGLNVVVPALFAAFDLLVLLRSGTHVRSAVAPLLEGCCRVLECLDGLLRQSNSFKFLVGEVARVTEERDRILHLHCLMHNLVYSVLVRGVRSQNEIR